MIGWWTEEKLKGKAEMVVRLMSSRAMQLTPEQRQLILGCTDESLLETWFDRSLTAKQASEVLESTRAPAEPLPH